MDSTQFMKKRNVASPISVFYVEYEIQGGLQGGYTKYPCFLCLWDSRADDQHYIRQEWPLRQGLEPRLHNVKSPPLVEPNKILLPPLHIKLGLMKNFVKAMDRKGKALLSFSRSFLG